MKRILFILGITILCLGFETKGQPPLQSVIKTYFRIHPFETKFSTFVTSLQKDPWFTTNVYARRTDSTFFFIEGTYKNFNPFRFSPGEIKLIVAEEEIIYSDSLKTHDTIINLQIMAVTNNDDANKKLVEKEFKRFHNSQSDHFSEHNYRILGDKNELTGEVYNYFVSPFSIAPVTIAWGFLPETNQYMFVITVRLKVKHNVAEYVTAPGEF